MPTVSDGLADTAASAIRLNVGIPYEITLTQAELDAAENFGNPEYDYFEFYADPLTTYTVQAIAASDAVDGALWMPSPTWPGHGTEFGFVAPAGTMTTLEDGFSVRNWDPGDRLVTTLVDGGLVRMAVRFDGWMHEYRTGEDFSNLSASDRSFFLRVVEGDQAGMQPQIDTVGTGANAQVVAPSDTAPIVNELEQLDGVPDVDEYLFTLKAGFHYDVVVRETVGQQSGERPGAFRVTVSEEGGASAWTLEADVDRMSTGDVLQTVTAIRIGDGFGRPDLQPGEDIEVRVGITSLFDPDRQVDAYTTGGYAVGGYVLEIVPSGDDHGNNRLSPTKIAVGGWQEGTLDPFYEISAAEPFGDRDWMEIEGGVEQGRFYVVSFDYEDGRPASMFATFHNDVAVETVSAPDFDVWQPTYTGRAWLEVDSTLDAPADWRVSLGSYETLEYGDKSDDVLQGQETDDFFDGRRGDDVLKGQKGDDLLLGSRGDDKLAGGGGQDRLVGDRGKDTLVGGSGADTLSGSEGRDKLMGGKGDDVLSGGNGRDKIKGGAGDDILSGGTGRDRLVGGAGQDTITANFDGDVVRAGEGSDRIVVDSAEGTQALRIKGPTDEGDLLDLTALAIEAFFVDSAFAGGGVSSVRTEEYGFSIDLDGDGIADRSIVFDSAEDADAVALEGTRRKTPEALFELAEQTTEPLSYRMTRETETIDLFGTRSFNLISGTDDADLIRNDGLISNLVRADGSRPTPSIDGRIDAKLGDDIIDIQPRFGVSIYGGGGDDFIVWNPSSEPNVTSAFALRDFRQPLASGTFENDYIIIREDLWGAGVSIDDITFSNQRSDGDYLSAHIVGPNGLEGTLNVTAPIRSSDPLRSNDATSGDFLSEDVFLFV